jgi:hypothetical protein
MHGFISGVIMRGILSSRRGLSCVAATAYACVQLLVKSEEAADRAREGYERNNDGLQKLLEKQRQR